MYYLNNCYCRWWQRLSSEAYSLPEGPVILVGNHRSGVDPLLVQAVVDRHLHFLMTREYYNSMWYFRWFFNYVGAIPVKPGGVNRRALEDASQALHRGKVLCIFPEGAANPRIPLKRVLPGAVVLALETGAPILPFRVTGVWPFDRHHMWPPFFRRGRAKISFGKIIHVPEQATDKASIRFWTNEMKKALLALSS